MKRDNRSLADLVFLGGGHAQVAAIKSFAMRPVAGLRLTIVTTSLRTPYSGMLPGYVEGVWQDDDLYIDLAHLAQIAGARLIVATCTGFSMPTSIGPITAPPPSSRSSLADRFADCSPGMTSTFAGPDRRQKG